MVGRSTPYCSRSRARTIVSVGGIMSYIPGAEVQDGWMLWTNDANYNTEMNPTRFSYLNWEAALGIDSVTEWQNQVSSNWSPRYPMKYYDRNMSDQMGLPVWLELESGPRRNTTRPNTSLAYHAVLHPQKSSGSSSLVLPAGSVAPGGKPLGRIRYITTDEKRRKLVHNL